MLKRHPSYAQIDKLYELNDGLAEWIWNSHYWVEYHPGYYECQNCKNRHTSEMPIHRDDLLCLKNPAVVELLKIYRGK